VKAWVRLAALVLPAVLALCLPRVVHASTFFTLQFSEVGDGIVVTALPPIDTGTALQCGIDR
jgi:hypothetical protein